MTKWWIDASYAVHPDMKSHTGGVFSLGKGAVYATSTRQKINTKSSTEAELVGIADLMPQVMWTRYFLEGQGFPVNKSIIYQDNQSAMLLEQNGRTSSSKRTRHINIRYYFITEKVQNGEILVEYCPTKDMIADFFTKPLQGAQFTTFRNFIMNIDVTDIPNHRSVLNIIDINDGSVKEKDNDDGWTIVVNKRHRKQTTCTDGTECALGTVNSRRTGMQPKK